MVSCTADKDHNVTSVFHKKMGIVNSTHCQPTSSDVPSVKITTLSKPEIFAVTRKITNQDLILGNILPIKSGNKIAFTCMAPTVLEIDSKTVPCHRNLISFRAIPSKIKLE
jgi:hypothetical protein